MSSTSLGKRIISGLTISILLLIISWSVWITKNTFSAQRTETYLQEYRVETKEKQNSIQEELKQLKSVVENGFNKLNDKIDLNTQVNNKNILDLQKQIVGLKK